MRYVMVDLKYLPRDKALGRKNIPADARGGRFNSLPHALAALKRAEPASRWLLLDRETGLEVKP